MNPSISESQSSTILRESKLDRSSELEVDTVIAAEDESSEGLEDSSSGASLNDRLVRLPSLLRRVGFVVLLVASGSFCLTGIGSLDAHERYYAFLGMTLVMALTGVFCVLRLHEAKGARAFLGLATALLPVHFLQLGGMLLIDGAGGDLPRLLQGFQLTALSETQNWVTLGLSLVLLPLVAYAGFSSLARTDRSRLTVVYLASNLLLLIPIRDPMVMALCLVGGFAALRAWDFRTLMHETRFRHLEGWSCRLVLYTPLALLAIRQVLLFPWSSTFIAALLAVTAYLNFFLVPKVRIGGVGFSGLRPLSMISLAASWMLVISDALSQYAGHFLILVVLPVSLAGFGLSFNAGKNAAVWRRLSAAMAVTSTLGQMWLYPTPWTSIICVAIAMAVTLGAFLMRERGLLYSGVIGLAVGLLYQLRYATLIQGETRWIILAVLGIATILAASLIERHGKQWITNARSLRSRLTTWDS